jgi:hypothetical protein
MQLRVTFMSLFSSDAVNPTPLSLEFLLTVAKISQQFSPMAWDFDLDRDDSFFPAGFGDFSLPFEPEQTFNFGTTKPIQSPKESKSHPERDPQALIHENDELRRTEVSLTEKFAQVSSMNDRLKGQLEECRTRFRTAIFSGFGRSPK